MTMKGARPAVCTDNSIHVNLETERPFLARSSDRSWSIAHIQRDGSMARTIAT
jgi:hypothetical protein